MRRSKAIKPHLKAQTTKQLKSTESDADLSKWDDFLKGSGLEKVTLHQYYLDKRDVMPSNADIKKLITNLFADAIDLGVIPLPRPYESKDFKFVVFTGGSLRRIEVALKSKPSTHPKYLFSVRHLGEDTLLSSSYVRTVLNTAAFEVGNLLANQ